jgi:glyoxylase-like metal-dependent hydrolase (beta-lactamase superfamily II)
LPCRVKMWDSTPSAIGFHFISTYLLEAGDSLVIIDPGPSTTVELLARYITEKLYHKVLIVLTHIHLDHASGAGLLARLLMERDINVRLRVHPRGAKHLVDPGRLWEASREAMEDTAYVYGYPYPAPNNVVFETKDEEVESLNSLELLYIHTPGHASHHQAVLARCDRLSIVFSGDAVGMYIGETGGLAPTTPPPFHADKYLRSLEKLESLDAEIVATTHNSMAPTQLIEVHKRQIDLWLKEAQAWKGSEEEYLKHMIRIDGLTARAYILLGKSRHTRRTLIHTAQGILGAIKGDTA